ncbi:phage protein Gp27 family protein [Kordiimonas marina]|uniref:phage protein Gp27 family protein n=1 Tax=Kordiimonas marina TaxID=2872312 RepID=UPI001FF45BE4|nr:phage protein Gp27 family protein [Kordiimonas marina]MCJ9428557.1 DUF3486 family protein [Kordiimonas marina]
MGRKAKIDRMPEEIRDLIAGLFNAGKTIDQVRGKLWELVEDGDLPEQLMPGRSALGHHKKKLDTYTEKVRRSREIADVLVSRFGSGPESKTARLNIEMGHTMMLDLFMAANMEPDEDGQVNMRVDPMGAMLMCKAIDHLASAAKKDAELVKKAREEAAKLAAEAVDDAAVEAGLNDEQAALIRAKILGVHDQLEQP